MGVDDPVPTGVATSADSMSVDAMSRVAREDVADSVRLQSSDGDTFEVRLKVAKLSRTIETMLRG